MKVRYGKYLVSRETFIVTAVGTIGRVMLMNFNVAFYLSLVLSSHPPDEPLWYVYELYKAQRTSPMFELNLNNLLQTLTLFLPYSTLLAKTSLENRVSWYENLKN